MRTGLKRIRLSPSMQILLSFTAIILIGALLLSLPIANSNGMWLNIVDSLFTSTSAVCVTGLVVVDTAVQFTLFGELVILILIQIGGLGIIVVSSFVLVVLRKKINLSNRLTIQESLNKETMQGVVKFIKKTIVIALAIEFVGMLLLLYATISYTGNFWKGLYYATFMSISAFCNAGFDVFGCDMSQFTSLYSFASNVMMLLPLMMLVVIGGLGFVVLFDIFKKANNRQHARLVLIMTSILLFGGAILFVIFEWNNPSTLGNMSVGEKILNGLFQSVTTRTAGMATLDQAMLTSNSKFLTMFLMFVGGAPNSTAGGIKVTTLFLILLFMFRLPNDAGDIRLKDRRVSRKLIMKAFRVVIYAVSVLLLAIVLVNTFEGGIIPLESVLFECVSALSTVGLSMGITQILTIPSKVVVILLMFIGRVGFTTIAMAVTNKLMNVNQNEIEFTNTDIIIG